MKKNENMVDDYVGILISQDGNDCFSLDDICFYYITSPNEYKKNYRVVIGLKNSSYEFYDGFTELADAQKRLSQIAKIHSDWNKRKLEMNNHGAYR